MAKLYPPLINGTIPAFYGDRISVPFSMNNAVGASEIAGFVLKIKNVNGDYKGLLYSTLYSDSVAYFSLAENKMTNDFTIGQYYKVQLAYIDRNENVGYYSTVGILKYSSKPEIYIEGLAVGTLNNNKTSYIGVYKQDEENGDLTEKLYSSIFNLYDSDNNLLETSGEILHDSSQDESSYEQKETYAFAHGLEDDKIYYIQFIVNTLNDLNQSLATKKYKISERGTVNPDILFNLNAEMDFDNGLIKLSMSPLEETSVQINIPGTFIISRSDNKTGVWNEIKRYELNPIALENWSLVDFTVEQGITYKYAYQQYNSNGIYSNKIISNEVYCDFEDTFLFDGKRQLKVRFNPKVSSFKKNLLEGKSDTIGSKYPFIIKNGRVEYKEFPISGLISYQMDENELFISKEELLFKQKEIVKPFTSIREKIVEPPQNLSNYNLAAERLFKMNVFDWLTNGEVKLFRSPAEGNFVVRLMDVSLSPIDSLGRMLHSFNSTAYEVADNSFKSYKLYNIVTALETEDIKNSTTSDYLTTTSINLINWYKLSDDLIDLIDQPTKNFTFRDMIPGVTVFLDGEPTVIGSTGFLSYQEEKVISKIQMKRSDMVQGEFNSTHNIKIIDNFSAISAVNIFDIPCFQVIGTEYLTDLKSYMNGFEWQEEELLQFQNLETFKERTAYLKEKKRSKNLLAYLSDIKTDILNLYYLRIRKRDEYVLYFDGSSLPKIENIGKYLYEDIDKTVKINLNTLNPLVTYRLYSIKDNVLLNYGIDGNTKQYFNFNDESNYTIYLDGKQMNFKDKEEYELEDPWFTSIALAPGVITEIGYSGQVKDFVFEFDTSFSATRMGEKTLLDLRNEYLNINNKRYSYLKDLSSNEVTRQEVKNAYDNYMKLLTNIYYNYRKENGLE